MTNSCMDDFTCLVIEQQANLRAYIAACGAQGDQVDDLAQEVFILAYKRKDELDHERDLGPWLRQVARNLLANERRKVARRSRLLQAHVSEGLEERAEHTTAQHLFERKEVLADLQKCLNGLSIDQQALLRGRYAEDLDSNILAERHNKSPANVRKILFRLRAQLKGCLDKHCGEGS